MNWESGIAGAEGLIADRLSLIARPDQTSVLAISDSPSGIGVFPSTFRL
jgi:hypothetical protein